MLQDIDIFPKLVQKSRYLSLSGCHAVGNGLRDPLGELIHVGGSVRAPTLGVNGADGWTRAKATAAARWWLPGGPTGWTQPGAYGVYTRVPHYIDRILQQASR